VVHFPARCGWRGQAEADHQQHVHENSNDNNFVGAAGQMDPQHTLKRGRGSSDETVSDVEAEVDGGHGAAVTDKLVLNINPAISQVADELREDLLSSLHAISTLKNEIEALKEKSEALKAENEKLKGGLAMPDSQATWPPSQDEDHHQEQTQRIAEEHWCTLMQRLQDETQNHAATLDKLDIALIDNKRLREMLGDPSATENRSGGDNCRR
jgi:regulator of replication initiation timing